MKYQKPVVLLTIILAIITFVLVTRSNTASNAYKKSVNLTPTNIRVVPYITSFTAIDNGDLKYYSDPAYDFHFSYPADLRVGYIQTQNGYVKQWGFTENYPGVIANSISLTTYNNELETNEEGIWEANIPQERRDYKSLLTLKSGNVYQPKSDTTHCTGYSPDGTKVVNNIEWHIFRSVQTVEKCAQATWYSEIMLYITSKSTNIYVFKVNPYTESTTDKLMVLFTKIVSSFGFDK